MTSSCATLPRKTTSTDNMWPNNIHKSNIFTFFSQLGVGLVCLTRYRLHKSISSKSNTSLSLFGGVNCILNDTTKGFTKTVDIDKSQTVLALTTDAILQGIGITQLKKLSVCFPVKCYNAPQEWVFRQRGTWSNKLICSLMWQQNTFTAL